MLSITSQFVPPVGGLTPPSLTRAGVASNAPFVLLAEPAALPAGNGFASDALTGSLVPFFPLLTGAVICGVFFACALSVFVVALSLFPVAAGVAGAGGGGGGGGGDRARYQLSKTYYCWGGGGGGGGRSSLTNSAGGASSTAGPWAASQPGGAGTISGAGAGGIGQVAGGYTGPTGGAGGNWGATGATGGAGGAATSGQSNVTWLATGTRYGALG